MRNGVRIPAPDMVYVDEDVQPERIATGSWLYPGTRLTGASTAIGPDCAIGEEMPATLHHCQLGARVALKGGYFAGATFLDDSSVGSGAHIRPGTLLEEEANGAHTVGFKQTILMPFVTTGSLLNFCDCLMAGGTSRKNHSEVGSSYIHFNYTPRGDKATASLIGDVPRGVMLDQQPVFLGGQGGLVGPVRIDYGIAIPAGVVWRKDALEGNGIYYPEPDKWNGRKAFNMGVYFSIKRIVRNCLIYIGNIRALRTWYRHVRRRFMDASPFQRHVFEGAVNQLDLVLAERIKRLEQLAGKMAYSLELAHAHLGTSLTAKPYAEQRLFMEQWPRMRDRIHDLLDQDPSERAREKFLGAWAAVSSRKCYTQIVQALPREIKSAGSLWLQSLVDEVAALMDVFSDEG